MGKTESNEKFKLQWEHENRVYALINKQLKECKMTSSEIQSSLKMTVLKENNDRMRRFEKEVYLGNMKRAETTRRAFL